MYEWAIIFSALAFGAAIFGFTGISATYAPVAQVLFYIFLSLGAFALFAGFYPRRRRHGRRLIIDIK